MKLKTGIESDQIRTLDRRRLIQSIGLLTENELSLGEKAVKIHLALS
jgi:mRNA-degrading endonuclease toxin of MazEF toxin-antitoxin module